MTDTRATPSQRQVCGFCLLLLWFLTFLSLFLCLFLFLLMLLSLFLCLFLLFLLSSFLAP